MSLEHLDPAVPEVEPWMFPFHGPVQFFLHLSCFIWVSVRLSSGIPSHTISTERHCCNMVLRADSGPIVSSAAY